MPKRAAVCRQHSAEATHLDRTKRERPERWLSGPERTNTKAEGRGNHSPVCKGDVTHRPGDLLYLAHFSFFKKTRNLHEVSKLIIQRGRPREVFPPITLRGNLHRFLLLYRCWAHFCKIRLQDSGYKGDGRVGTHFPFTPRLRGRRKSRKLCFSSLSLPPSREGGETAKESLNRLKEEKGGGGRRKGFFSLFPFIKEKEKQT